MTHMRWSTMPLKRLASVRPSNIDKNFAEGETRVRLCNYVDVYKSERITSNMQLMQASASAAQIERFSLLAQDVIVTKDSETPTDIGVPAHVPKDMPGVVCGYHLSLLRPEPSQLYGGFLYWALQSSKAHDYFATNALGITRYALNTKDLEQFPLSTPSRTEQELIANFLDEKTARIDALIAEKERFIERLEELCYSTLSWAVTGGYKRGHGTYETGNPFVPELPTGWAFGGLTKYIGPVVDYRGKTPEKVVKGILLVTARNIRDGRLDYQVSAEYVRPEAYEDIMRRGIPEIGDVLFTMEAPLGQVANVDRTDIALAQRVVKFRGVSGVLNCYFLKYWLMGDAVQATLDTLATGSTAEGIKASKLGRIPLAIPSLAEQAEIVAFLDERRSTFDAAAKHTQEHIDRLREYRSSVISAAVTGQLEISQLQEAS